MCLFISCRSSRRNRSWLKLMILSRIADPAGRLALYQREALAISFDQAENTTPFQTVQGANHVMLVQNGQQPIHNQRWVAGDRGTKSKPVPDAHLVPNAVVARRRKGRQSCG